MKLSDYVADFLARRGARDVFLVSGGGIMHLLDSVGRHPELRYYCNYHEQASAVSAEGYARIRGFGVCLVTLGPGAVNALAGILGAWVDSIPLLVISGQVRTDLIRDPRSGLRQLGPQEGDVIEMARPVTKYAESVRNPQRIREVLERAFFEARSGRPGPVWVEIPLDVQGAAVDPEKLPGFDEPAGRLHDFSSDIRDVVERLRNARRPILVPGNAIHQAACGQLLLAFLEKAPIPVALPYTAKDILPEDHPCNIGVFGTSGQRRANFAVQNSDVLLALGAGLSCSKVGFNYRGFAPKATKILVDVDDSQLREQVVKPDLAVQADVRPFLEALLKAVEVPPLSVPQRWLEACNAWKQRYPVIVDEFLADPDHVNSYVFMDRLADALEAEDRLVGGNGLDCVSFYQAFRVKGGQRAFVSGNWGSMGWDLPLAVGVCIASNRRRTVCVTGDGSLQWNIQELLTISHNRLPIKVFVFNNRGYSSIRATQAAFAEGRFVGSDPSSGVANPNFQKLAEAYGIRYERIGTNAELPDGLGRSLWGDEPILCEVNIAPSQWVSPKASAFRRADGTLESRPLEDMAPFLPREEVWENMHLFDGDEAAVTSQEERSRS